MSAIIEHWVHQHSGSFVALVAVVMMSIIQITPIKVNPWTYLVRVIRKLINGSVLDELKIMDKKLDETNNKLEKHIRIDDDRNADAHRTRILQFNNELIRNIRHTREDFVDILSEIDFYERYCRDHKEYENNRATHAIINIKRVYDELSEKRDFAL